MGVVYTDDEAASLTSEQFEEYMNGGDPLGKEKKKGSKPPQKEKTDMSAAGAARNIRDYHKRLKEIE